LNIVICDIDGCLTKGKNHSLQLIKLQRIKKLIKNSSWIFSISTGRSQPYVELFCQILGITEPCICENGSYLYDPLKNKVIYPSRNDYYQKLHNLKTTLIPQILKGINYTYEVGKEASISINSSCEISFLFELLKKKITDEGFSITFSHTAVDIMLPNIDKGKGVDFYFEYMKYSPDKIMGIGDSVGDIPFLLKSDVICCPSNSDKKVKNISHYISEKSFLSGTIDILKTQNLFDI